MSGTLKALFDIRDGNNGENFSGLAKVLNSTEVQITNLPSRVLWESACRRKAY